MHTSGMFEESTRFCWQITVNAAITWVSMNMLEGSETSIEEQVYAFEQLQAHQLSLHSPEPPKGHWANPIATAAMVLLVLQSLTAKLQTQPLLLWRRQLQVEVVLKQLLPLSL